MPFYKFKKSDIALFLGKEVKITLFRRGKYLLYEGTLTELSHSEVCLVNKKGVPIWIDKPRLSKDSVKEVIEFEYKKQN